MSISEPFVSYCHKGLYKVDGGIGSTDSEILNTYTAKKMDVSGCTSKGQSPREILRAEGNLEGRGKS